jgi:hypothetical protein
MMVFIEMIVQAIGEVLSGEILMRIFKRKEKKHPRKER